MAEKTIATRALTGAGAPQGAHVVSAEFSIGKRHAMNWRTV